MENYKIKNNPIIIIGMHRSGTSMLTRFIEESGIYMGKYRGINDESFFFQEINEWLLYQASSTWDNPHNIKYINNYFIENTVSIVQKRLNSFWSKKYYGLYNYFKYKGLYKQDYMWGWKDPKTTLLLPIWKRVFPNAKIIHIYRNPIDIAVSLKKRELEIEHNFNLSFKKRFHCEILRKRPIFNQSSRIYNLKEGYKLWEEYVNLAFKANELFQNVIHIKYEDFLQKPNLTLKNLGNFLDLPINDNIINNISKNINPSRAYAFLNNTEYKKLYVELKDTDTMKKLGYDKILKDNNDY